ncbi:hypothetical protein PYW07_007586 [Mythimna separata]|uniref:Uncharacterized protein n=1 Tax=Mythimna separata TaxID=271217 RepID=A0AAD7YR41_MYTSE|nr:hypothetical protein PYW07_007586 [Mythimna separata]
MNNETEHIFLLNPAPSESTAPTQGLGTLEQPPVSQVNLDNVKDFSHVCRTCATITEFVMPIFADEGLQNNLADKIHKHLPIKVCKGDELPLVVCYQCASTLLAWHELVQCCMQADAALRAKLRSSQRKTNRPSIKPSTSIEEDTESKTVVPDEENLQEDDKTKIEMIEKPEFTISEDGKRYAKCGVCQKSVSVGGWSRHRRAHAGERRHSCHACGLAFNDSGNLARHARAVHAQQRPHACPTCHKTFSRKSHLEDHVKSHSESRTFVCDVCGKGSKSSAALRMHARTHWALRFACVQCGARFKRRGELRAHVSVHTGERAHACRCGKAFRLRSQLTAHQRLHQKAQLDETGDLYDDSNVPEICDEEMQ